ncbi:hypothetical protein QCA50_013285 [Cerrena zonata]|uniref:DUF6534 domain-containing protein n=1 Tax=Cerrena zonata TaxID=2478898 RepID=A0AAW0FTM0_9APHY
MANIVTDGIDLTGQFSPIFWGFVVSLVLGGITILQAYIYFYRFNDRLEIRTIAATMLALDVVSSALVAQSIYYYLLPHFGSLEPLSSVTPELSAECLISTIITFISQMYFVYQLYILHHLKRINIMFTILIGVGACLALAGGIACVITMYIFHHGVLSNRNDMFAIFFGIAKAFGAFTDILATVCMTVFLKSSITGVIETKKLLNNLIQFVIQRGALVTLIQTLLLITFFAAPNSLSWFAFHVNVTKLYANTFFAMLNGRDRREKRRMTARNDSYNLHFTTPDHSRGELNSQSSHSVINVTKSVIVADV